MEKAKIILTLKNVTKKFEEEVVLDGIDLEIKQGEKIAVIGGSGVGKTTLLRCINLLEEPTSGEIVFDGKLITKNEELRTKNAVNINTTRRQIGFVFQNFNLFANMTVLKNITLAPLRYDKPVFYKKAFWNFKQRGDNKKVIEEKALGLLKKFGLQDKANAYPHTLSGGGKQRVAILRALINDPAVMLFDEPTSSLDPEMKHEVLETIKALDKKLSVVLVTHELNFAKNFASRVLFLDNGKIIEQGTPEQIFNKPKTEQLQKFLAKVLS